MSIASPLHEDVLWIPWKCLIEIRQFQDSPKMSWRCLLSAGLNKQSALIRKSCYQNKALIKSIKKKYVYIALHNLFSLKNEEKCFLLILKALFVLKIFKFLPWLFRHVEKTAWLERKANFKIYYLTTWLTKNCRHISHEESNQTLKFGQIK